MDAELPSSITVSEGNTWTPCSIPKGVLVSSAGLSGGDVCPACTCFPIPWAALNQPLQSSNTAGEFCWPPSREGSNQVASNKLQFNMLNYITLCTYVLFFVAFSRHMLQLPLFLTSGACFHTKQAHVVSSHVLVCCQSLPFLPLQQLHHFQPSWTQRWKSEIKVTSVSSLIQEKSLFVCSRKKNSIGISSAQKNIKLNYN